MNVLDLKDARLRGVQLGKERVLRAQQMFFNSLVRSREGQAVTDILADPAMEQFYKQNHPEALDKVRRRYGQGKLR